MSAETRSTGAVQVRDLDTPRRRAAGAPWSDEPGVVDADRPSAAASEGRKGSESEAATPAARARRAASGRRRHKRRLPFFFPDAFARLRVRVLGALSREDGAGARVVGFTAREPGEGVTTCAVGLARALVRFGDDRVLLVDGGFAGRRAARTLRARGVTPLTAAQLRASRPANDVVRSVESGLDVMILEGPSSARALIDSDEGRALWRELLAEYDLVVVDCGPLTEDAVFGWARRVGLMLLVVDVRHTALAALQRFGVERETMGLRIDGFVLNRRKFPIPGFLYRGLV